MTVEMTQGTITVDDVKTVRIETTETSGGKTYRDIEIVTTKGRILVELMPHDDMMPIEIK